MPIQPTMDNVLIEPIVEEKSKGGILLVKSNVAEREIPSNKGKVIAVGPGRFESGKFVETTVKVGSEVYFHTYPLGCAAEEDGKKYVLIPEKQIVAVRKEK